MKNTIEIKKAVQARLNEYKRAGVDGFVFACQALIERNKNVNFTYVDIETVKEYADTLFKYDKGLNGVYFRKSRAVDPLLHHPKFPIGKRILSIPTENFEKDFAENYKDKGINKGGYCEVVALNKSVEEIKTDKSLVDGQIMVDGKVKNIQLKSSIISVGEEKTNNGCSNAELIKFKKGE